MILIKLKNDINNVHTFIEDIETKVFYILYIGESNRIRTVPEYGHSRYFRNHKSYKKMFNE